MPAMEAFERLAPLRQRASEPVLPGHREQIEQHQLRRRLVRKPGDPARRRVEARLQGVEGQDAIDGQDQLAVEQETFRR